MKHPTLKLLKDRCVDEGGRWIWQQMLNQSGVPQIKVGLRNVSVYRLAYCLHHKLKLDALGADVIWPTTEQRDINPETLMRGTRAQMMNWRKAQGQTKRSAASRAIVTAASRARSTNKMTPEKLAIIRASTEPSRVVAATVGLARSTVSKVRAGTLWANAVPQASVFGLGGV